MKKRDGLDILRVLSSIQNANHTCRQLAELIGGSTRTVQGYIRTLVSLGNPIRTIRAGKHTCYTWDGPIVQPDTLNVQYMEGFNEVYYHIEDREG